MNKLIVEVIEITSNERLNLIKCKFKNEIISVLILELNMNIKVGSKLELLIKPTALSIISEQIYFENILKVKIKNIQKDKILTSIIVEVEDTEFEVITLNRDFKNECYVVFKANDIIISKVLDD